MSLRGRDTVFGILKDIYFLQKIVDIAVEVNCKFILEGRVHESRMDSYLVCRRVLRPIFAGVLEDDDF